MGLSMGLGSEPFESELFSEGLDGLWKGVDCSVVRCSESSAELCKSAVSNFRSCLRLTKVSAVSCSLGSRLPFLALTIGSLPRGPAMGLISRVSSIRNRRRGSSMSLLGEGDRQDRNCSLARSAWFRVGGGGILAERGNC